MSAMDSNIKAEIKAEPKVGDELGADDDVYEDTGECAISPPGQETKAWLARLPKWLWEAWATIAEDEEIELGKVRVYNNGPPGKTKMKMVLNDIPGHASVPKRYDIDMTQTDYNNTVAFSEKDLPSLSGEGWKRSRPPRTKSDRKTKPLTYDNDKISKKPFRSSIPKQTALAGYLQHEVSVLAVDNDEYRELSQKWLQGLQKNAAKTTFNLGTGPGGARHPGVAFHPGVHTTAGVGSFTSASAKQIKQKRQQEKAVRIPEAELLDMLFAYFREYSYWSLKALKQHTRQPEAHIKTVIDKIATLVRSGPFASTYKLNPEYASISAKVKGAAAEDGESDEDNKNDDGEDDEGDFEDVKMEG